MNFIQYENGKAMGKLFKLLNNFLALSVILLNYFISTNPEPRIFRQFVIDG
jgi:hypothetical protein